MGYLSLSRRLTVSINRNRFAVTTHHNISRNNKQRTQPLRIKSKNVLSSMVLTRSASSSVATDEVSKFSSLASTWWDPKSNPLIYMNPTRMSFIVEILRNNGLVVDSGNRNMPLEGLKALDVGCGGGLLSESLARLGCNVTAIDPSQEIVDVARKHSKLDSKTSRINFRGQTSIEQLAEEKNRGNENESLFDIICILEVIEHTNNPLSLIQSARSLLKPPTENSPGGLLFVSTVNRTAKSYAVAILGAEYITRMLPVGTHSWEKFLSPNEVRKMAHSIELSQVDVSGMVLKPPFLDFSWKLDKTDTDINWIGCYKHSI